MISQIFNEDCLETLKKFKDNSIKFIISSPPYDKLRLYNGFCFDAKKVIPELYRVIEHGGVVVWVIADATVKGSETGTSFRQALLFMEIGFNLHDTMIWDKKHVFGTCGNPPLRYAQAFEYIFVFTKGRIKTFNPIMENCIQKDVIYSGTTRRDRRSNKLTACLTVKRDILNKDTKIKNNIFTYSVGFNKTSKDKIAFKHPAIYPEQLANDMIISYTNKGDLIYGFRNYC
jgi:DNA modification methylase